MHSISDTTNTRSHTNGSVAPLPLSATRLVTVPGHLETGLQTTPVLVHPYQGLGRRPYLAPDFAELFPVDGERTRKGRRSRARTAAGAAALYLGVELAFDSVRIACGDGHVWGDRLEVVDGTSFRAGDLLGLLPATVVEWLDGFTPDDGASWTAMLLAEIQLHGLHLATGTWPQPHSTGSEMALHMAIEQAVDWLKGVSGGETCMGIDKLGGADDALHALELLGGILFEDHDVLWLDEPVLATYAMGCDDLHPRNWFTSFLPDSNPWLTRNQTGAVAP